MISEGRSTVTSEQPLVFPGGTLVSSPKRRLAKLGRKPSNGSMQSNSSSVTTGSAESVTVRQPSKSKIRRHNNRLSTVFFRSSQQCDGGQGDALTTDDPSELSNQVSAPGILKIFGNDICQGANYKSVLATTHSSAMELVKEAVERYCLDKAEADAYVLCDVIGHVGEDSQWKTECFRVVGDSEKPLLLQSLWKPKEGFSRRFEIQRRTSVEEMNAREKDTVTAGINAQARKLQRIRSRVASVYVDGCSRDSEQDGGLWRSLSDMDLTTQSKGACWSPEALLRGPPGAQADKEALCAGGEKEETESSDDNATQYSIHPPFDFPYFLLLQGYSYRQDFVIYLMSGMTTIFGRCSEHSTGEDVESLKVDILLSAPDILPQHCCMRRMEIPDQEERRRTLTLLKPLHGAPVTCNGIPLGDETELHPGDLVRLGEHYLFMFKDPTALHACQTPLWLNKSTCLHQGMAVCNTCSSSYKETQRRPQAQWKTVPHLKDSEGQDLSLLYELEHEDRVLKEIMTMVNPHGEDPKLTPGFLLCLCIQHSATNFSVSDFRRLLLRVASKIQTDMWEKTKELAEIQAEMASDGLQEPEEVRPLSMEELIPGLRPLVLWMANAIELLHFIQQEVPKLLSWSVDEEEEATALSDSHVSSVWSAMEEAVTVLEEVIMFTFQQSVYYLTKTLYAALPRLLDSNPFSESGQLLVPEGMGSILDTLEQTLQLLNSFQVHSEITSQLFAYLFFFINASLFNTLMERGSGGGFYHWARGVQIRANLDLLMDWIQGTGLGDLALDFLPKFSSAVNLLATPKENLLQASWRSLRTEFVHLNPAQLHHMLREYKPGRACPAGWTPSPEEADGALSTADILESFDNHPPLILPSSGFHLQLGKPIKDACLTAQLGRLQESLQSLPVRQPTAKSEQPLQSLDVQSSEGTQSVASPSKAEPQDPEIPVEIGTDETVAHPGEGPESELSEPVSAAASHHAVAQPVSGPSALSSCEAVLTQKLKSLELRSTNRRCHKRLALDPSCLLTPPNTPQGLELGNLEAGPLEGAPLYRKAKEMLLVRSSDGSLSPARMDVMSEGEDEEKEEVFTVELQRGPHGIGLALVDGMETPLKMNGIYIKSVVPDSPAVQSQKLSQGDRILAVNGLSLVGMDYRTGRDLIRTSGDKLRLLVAKSEWIVRGPFVSC